MLYFGDFFGAYKTYLQKKKNSFSSYFPWIGPILILNVFGLLCPTCATMCDLIGLIYFSYRPNQYCPINHIYSLARKNHYKIINFIIFIILFLFIFSNCRDV